MTFGEKLRKIRKEHGLTQKDVADMLGVVQATISDYERKATLPNIKTVIKFANVFGCDIKDLMPVCMSEEENIITPFSLTNIYYQDYLTWA